MRPTETRGLSLAEGLLALLLAPAAAALGASILIWFCGGF